MGKTLFITATDTGVGKTTVSAALAKILKERGVKVGYFKPVETGVEDFPLDGKLLTDITGQPLEEAVLYRFRNPVAPYPASEIEGTEIDLNKIKKHYYYMKDKYEFLIVEGAGGVYVPVVKGYTYVDFVRELNLPVLIVARAKLGTINHTVLTVKALEGAKITGIVMNGFEGTDISEETNPRIIQEMTGLSVVAKCGKSQRPSDECFESLKPVFETIYNQI